MNTRKDTAGAPSASTDNSHVETVAEQPIVNEYLQLPRVLLSGFRDDMTNYLRLHPETDGGNRAMRLRLLEAIISNTQMAPEPQVVETIPVDDFALRARLKVAEKLLKEAESLVTPASSKVNTRVKHVIAGSLEWRIGEFLLGRWPRKGEQ